MKQFSRRFYRAVLRVIPNCITQSQAVAFNMFLAFFPMVLVVLGIVASSEQAHDAVQEIVTRMQPVLPPGTTVVLSDFVAHHGAHSWEWISLGTAGTLIAGTQMMKLLMEGFRIVSGDAQSHGTISRNLRALILLVATIGPALFTVNLFVFGKQLRAWMLYQSSMPVLIRLVWSALYFVAGLLIATLVLSAVYRLGRYQPQRWRTVVPGALVATLMWWIVSAAFGYYMRHAPYGVVYGGLATAIALMLWMNLTSSILFIGAAYNAELQSVAAAGVQG